MNKPNGYDEATAFTGDFETISLGGHVCIIKQAKLDKTSTDKDVLILVFDIAEGENKDFYKRDFERRKESNADAKWHGTYRQLTEGKSLSFFKGMITAIEQSNNGYKWNWDETTLKGKLFGGVFGEEEFRKQDGSIGKSIKCRFVRSVEQVKKGVEIPAIKKLNDSASDGFPVDNSEDDPPF